jgi:uncharacterized protein
MPAAGLDRPGLISVDPVEVGGQLTFADPGFLLDLRTATRVSVECDRCLTPVGVELAGRMQLMVAASRARPKDESEERELGEDEMGVLEVAGEGFESGPLVREQILLDLPAKPLCRDDCRGLCPVCGAELNLGRCGCEARAIDPRWAALEVVRSKLDGAS